MTKMTIGITGLGVIGQRWAAAFAHAGHDVRAFDPDPSQKQNLEAILPSLMADLDMLHPDAGRTGAISIFPTLEEALSGVGFVQENGPEKIEIKRSLLAEIERHTGPETVIASSSSALLVSEMQAECANPGRIVLGHPFNPVHLMPLVEIAGGNRTERTAIETARTVYAGIGKKPVVLNREVTGHLALRLMAAMWREAIALVRDGVASVEDVDRAFIYGPGPKWTLQGSFISNQLNAASMEDFLRKYGPTYEAIWDTLLDAKLDDATVEAVSRSTALAVNGRNQDQLRHEREAGLLTVLADISRHGAL